MRSSTWVWNLILIHCFVISFLLERFATELTDNQEFNLLDKRDCEPILQLISAMESNGHIAATSSPEMQDAQAQQLHGG